MFRLVMTIALALADGADDADDDFRICPFSRLDRPGDCGAARGLRALGERVRGNPGHAAGGGDSGLPDQ